MRIEDQAERITQVLYSRPDCVWYALDIARVADLNPGAIYPALARLERLGLVQSDWEASALAGTVSRPRRRVYWLADSIGDARGTRES